MWYNIDKERGDCLSKVKLDRDKVEQLLTGDNQGIEMLRAMDEQTFDSFANKLKEEVLSEMMESSEMLQISVSEMTTDEVARSGSFAIVAFYCDEVAETVRALGMPEIPELGVLQDRIIALDFRDRVGKYLRKFNKEEA